MYSTQQYYVWLEGLSHTPWGTTVATSPTLWDDGKHTVLPVALTSMLHLQVKVQYFDKAVQPAREPLAEAHGAKLC